MLCVFVIVEHITQRGANAVVVIGHMNISVLLAVHDAPAVFYDERAVTGRQAALCDFSVFIPFNKIFLGIIIIVTHDGDSMVGVFVAVVIRGEVSLNKA